MNVLAHALVRAAEGEKTFEAHHWLFPETKEIIWGGLAFVLVAFVLYRFGYPAAKKGYAARTERIANQLAEAAQAREAAEQDVAQVRAATADLDAEVERILAHAREAAAAMRADQLARIETELAETRAKALADIEASKARALSEVQASVAQLSIGAAEHLVRSSLDEATQQDLVERFIQQVGATGRAS